MTAPRTELEKQIQREIEANLGAEPDLLLLRNSVGAAQFFTEEGKAFYVPYGLGTGSPDLVAMLRVELPNGLAVAVWFCIEVKADKGDLSEEQKRCHPIWKRFGALIYVARNVKEARAALDDARRIVRKLRIAS